MREQQTVNPFYDILILPNILDQYSPSDKSILHLFPLNIPLLDRDYLLMIADLKEKNEKEDLI